MKIKTSIKYREPRTNKAKHVKTTTNKGNTRITKSYRFLEIDAKRLKRIAGIKKTTETRVLTELVRIAYAGLTMPLMKDLNDFYKKLLNEPSNKHKKEGIK